jgi:beta-lactamase class A
MRRRTLIGLMAAALTAGADIAAAPAGRADGAPGGDDLDRALARFLRLPGRKSYLVHIGDGGTAGRFAHRPDLFLFTASAFKTFVLAQYLRAVEAGQLSEKQELTIDDSVRSPGSPVFIDLTGTTTARVVLEAMITHSDNTATDAAMRQVGADQVRALIAEAGLSSILIPDSTRIFASYIVGAPPGVDLGWPGIIQAFANPPGPLRPLLNRVQSLAGSARDFVSWYEQALSGAFFSKPQTLTEFKRIQAMAEQIVKMVPPDTPAYAKGGEVADFNGFNAKSFAGQMIVNGQTPVTFCFIVNWMSPTNDFAEVEAEYFAAIAGILSAVAQDAAPT